MPTRPASSITAGVLIGWLVTAQAFQIEPLDDAHKRILDENFQLVLHKKKGPYSQNYCVCSNGEKRAVLADDGSVDNRCGVPSTQFCSAFRERWTKAIAGEGMYIGNLFSPDLYEWQTFPNKHDLVRGYILEKYFVDTHPKHKLAEMKAYGGLSGAEYEARDMPLFFERYLAEPDFNDSRHFILAYELQKRFYVRNDRAKIQDVRNLASRIYGRDNDFKPLRDATHNQISRSLLPRLGSYRDAQPVGSAIREDVEKLMVEIENLTSLDESVLAPQLVEIQDASTREILSSTLPKEDAGAIRKIVSLGKLTVVARAAVAGGKLSPADRRRLVDINVTANAVVHSVGSKLLDDGGPRTVREHLELIGGLVDASYGAGLLTAREREAAAKRLAEMLARESTDIDVFRTDLARVERVVEWGHNGAMLGFGEVWAPWTYLLPDVIQIGDDIVRGSPMLILAQTSRRLGDYLAGEERIRHYVFGTTFTSDVRALNPGLALGTLRVAPGQGGYARDELVALPETPADLKPAAGIVTLGEGNVVSHVQLLARSLGIPNSVVSSAVYELFKPHSDKRVFMAVTPGGRVYVKEAAAMTATDKTVFDEFNRNTRRAGDGALVTSAGSKLHIDTARLNVEDTVPMSLDDVRRKDSGVRSGPKAAFLGELRHLFPNNVARGVVVPFGSYLAHFRKSKVAIPEALRNAGIGTAGEPLELYAARTYDEFFGKLVPAKTPEQELAAWIQPRLEIIRYSIRQTPLSPELKDGILQRLDEQGLLIPGDTSRTVGCFVRSDTNVEDQDNFNGAGLNLTIFNLKSLEEIFDGLKEVWASPFTYRSFSWRQTLIDEPMWVLPSVVILESIPSEKSGVLVTADIDSGDRSKMLIATSEGVGGAVDGTPAETLLWSREGVELLTQFKSPYRRLLSERGGVTVTASTGSDYVLTDAEIELLTDAATKIAATLEPARGPSGQPRAWDIEFGFAAGKLWLFQVRPFIGNEDIQNLPALAALESGSANSSSSGTVTLEEQVK